MDDCTFWYTRSTYATTTSFAWRTRIGSFKFPGCGGSPNADTHSDADGDANSNANADANSDPDANTDPPDTKRSE